MAVNSSWVFPTPTTWILKEKLSWTGDDFQIMDEDENVVIEAKAADVFRGSSMKEDWKDKVTFCDARTGEELFFIQKKSWQWTPTYTVQRNGQTVAVLSKKAFSFSDALKVYGGEDKSAPVIFTVKQPFQCNPFKVGYSGRRRVFYEGDDEDVEVAQSKEERCNSLEACGMDEYHIEVEENVDVLMILAIQVALDEMEEDKDD